MASFIADHFATARLHIKEQPTAFHRFSARWTPTVLMLGPDGRELPPGSGISPSNRTGNVDVDGAGGRAVHAVTAATTRIVAVTIVRMPTASPWRPGGDAS